eukprot:gene29695-36785_t
MMEWTDSHYLVHRLVRDFPDLTFVLNGGIQTLQQGKAHMNNIDGYRYECVEDAALSETLPAVHGIMIGRTAYSNPIQFATADSTFHGIKDPGFSRRQIIDQYLDYCEWVQSELGPRRAVSNRPERGMQLVSTSVLINSMRNLICGIPKVNQFRTALNDIYMDLLKSGTGNPNPDCRAVIEGAMEVLNETDLDAPLGNVFGFDDEIRTISSSVSPNAKTPSEFSLTAASEAVSVFTAVEQSVDALARDSVKTSDV